MLENLVVLLRSSELTHASEKIDFTTKRFGADKEIRSQELRRLRGGGQSARSSDLWLAGAIPLNTVHSNSLLHFLLFWETHDLVWEIISVSEKTMKNCIVKIIDNVFEKMTKVVYFP